MKRLTLFFVTVLLAASLCSAQTYQDASQFPWIRLQATDTTPPAVEGALYHDLSEHIPKVYANGSWTALGAGTFAGGSVTADIVMTTGEYIRSSTTTAHTTGLQGYDVDGTAYVNGISVTNGNTVAVALGAATASVAITSTGFNVSTAGAVSGVTTLAASGNVTTAGVTFGTTGGSEYIAVVDLADSDMVALRGTPVELIAAPGEGKYIEVVACQLIFDYGSGTAYAESADNLILGYDDGTTQIGNTLEMTGFIDQTADMVLWWVNSATARAAALAVNQNVALKNSGDGEIVTGDASDGALRVIITYRVYSSLGL